MNWKNKVSNTVLRSDLTHAPATHPSLDTPEAGRNHAPKAASWFRNAVLAAVLAATPAMQSCEPKEVKPDVVVDKYAGMTQEQKMEAWHQEAEKYANDNNWSQGAKLAAGNFDNYYYKESANGPILVRVCYKVQVDDFIAKIEADAANRKNYDPKTEGVFQATLASLEGDNKNTAWFVPSTAIYEAKAAGKSEFSLKPWQFPAPLDRFNNISAEEGLPIGKQMQIYSNYWKTKTSDVDKDRVLDLVRSGSLKDIL